MFGHVVKLADITPAYSALWLTSSVHERVPLSLSCYSNRPHDQLTRRHLLRYMVSISKIPTLTSKQVVARIKTPNNESNFGKTLILSLLHTYMLVRGQSELLWVDVSYMMAQHTWWRRWWLFKESSICGTMSQWPVTYAAAWSATVGIILDWMKILEKCI